MTTETTEQIVREAPEVEAYKLALLRDAQALASQPAGLPQFDADGRPIMESYNTGQVDADGNPVMAQRQSYALPRQQVAGMSDMQTQAMQRANEGVGAFQPYIQGATNTLGAAQSSMTNALANAQPYQDSCRTVHGHCGSKRSGSSWCRSNRYESSPCVRYRRHAGRATGH